MIIDLSDTIGPAFSTLSCLAIYTAVTCWFLTVDTLPSRVRRIVCMLLALVFIGVPVFDEHPVYFYVRGFTGDMSMASLIFASIALTKLVSGKTIVDHNKLKPVLYVCGILAALLYPMSLGLGPVDTYFLGYGNIFFVAGLFVIALLSWHMGHTAIVIWLVLSITAYLSGLMESDNLWDYLLDPFIGIWGFLLCIHRALSANNMKPLPAGLQKFNRLELNLLTMIICMGFFGAILSFAHHRYFAEIYVVEDGVVEWLTVFALLMSCGLCLRRIFNLRSSKPPFFLFCTGILALLFFFGAGEEISWGQRIFGIESSEFFQENNAQGETNLHNLIVGDTKINKLIFGRGFALLLLTYLLVVTPLYRKKQWARDFFDRFGVPIPKNYHVIAYVVLLVVVEGIMESSKKGELTEFVCSYIVFLNFYRPWNQGVFEKPAAS
jgi:hypothetical protein